MTDAADPRLHFPATMRNREPILAVLARVLPRAGVVLEIGSGSGEHVAHFARHLPHLRFQPSDPSEAHVASIDGWTRFEALANVEPARRLDAEQTPWSVAHADAVFAANVLHIAPWSVCVAIMEGAHRVVPADAPLVLYGPFRQAGAHTAPSNAEFDESLRSRDPRWGVRDLEAVSVVAATFGWVHAETVSMPANNLTLVYRRR